MSGSPVELSSQKSSRIAEADMKKVLVYLKEPAYDSITLVVHDGKVALVEKLENIKI